MWLDEYDEMRDEIREEESSDAYMEEIIACLDCGRTGPRYEIEGHSCADLGDAA